MAKNNDSTGKNPTHGVYIVEGEGFNINLSAVPLSGRLVIRTLREREGQ